MLAANKRLNTAYMLKESFGQLWSYEREGWARRFFENWRASLKWQRLKPYEKFAAMIDRHWDGIAAYCRPENKVSLGFVEGLNNKIRVHPAPRLRLAQRRIPAAQDPHLHAAGTVTSVVDTPPEASPASGDAQPLRWTRNYQTKRDSAPLRSLWT